MALTSITGSSGCSGSRVYSTPLDAASTSARHPTPIGDSKCSVPWPRARYTAVEVNVLASTRRYASSSSSRRTLSRVTNWPAKLSVPSSSMALERIANRRSRQRAVSPSNASEIAERRSSGTGLDRTSDRTRATTDSRSRAVPASSSRRSSSTRSRSPLASRNLWKPQALIAKPSGTGSPSRERISPRFAFLLPTEGARSRPRRSYGITNSSGDTCRCSAASAHIAVRISASRSRSTA